MNDFALSKKWLFSLEKTGDRSRLVKGKSYARQGHVTGVTLNMQTGELVAEVKGSRRTPYQVEWVMEPLSDEDKQVILSTIKESPTFLAAFAQHKVPVELIDALKKKGIVLIPSDWEDFSPDCTCPDWGYPCKHIAAVFYYLGQILEREPLQLFSWYQCDMKALLTLDGSVAPRDEFLDVLKLADTWKPLEKGEAFPERVPLTDLNFSKIPRQGDALVKALPPFPSPWRLDLNVILAELYRHWAKNPSAGLDVGNSWVDEFSTDEEDVVSIWELIKSKKHVQFVMDEDKRLDGIYAGRHALFENESNSELFLMVKFLQMFPEELREKSPEDLQFVLVLYDFALQLFRKGAMIPRLKQYRNGRVFANWEPALFIPEVKEIFLQLCAACPKRLVTIGQSMVTPDQQVKSLLGLMMFCFSMDNYPNHLHFAQTDLVLELLFSSMTFDVSSRTYKQVVLNVQSWLAPWYLLDKPYSLRLHCKESDDQFVMEVEVTLAQGKAPISIIEALKLVEEDQKQLLFHMVYALLNYFPDEAREGGPGVLWTFEMLADFIEFGFPRLKTLGIEIIFPGNLQLSAKPKLNFNLSAREDLEVDRMSFLNLERLLDFRWEMAIGKEKIDAHEFKKLLSSSDRLVKVHDQYVFLKRAEKYKLLDKLNQIPKKMSQMDLMQAVLAEETPEAKVKMDKKIRELRARIRNPEPVPVPSNLNAKLRPYQIQGFHWLVQNMVTGFGSILADDMGLGKTIQVITAILHIHQAGWLKEYGNVLVVAPTSVLSNWKREIEKFAPDLSVSIYHGAARALCQQSDVILTSYGCARRDEEKLSKKAWCLLVIDEAQNIKNPVTEQSKAIKSIPAVHKIALSGTPVENRLLEYWSIFDFTNKHYLGGIKKFKTQYANPIEKYGDIPALTRFTKITAPFILRRMKTDKKIISDLPDKIDKNCYCELSKEQVVLYQRVVNDSLKQIEAADGIQRRGLVLNLINALKQICNHPAQFSKEGRALVQQSGKLLMLIETLMEIQETGEKTLIFTQYTEMGKLLIEVIGEKFKSEVPFLHGGLSLKKRDEIVNGFQEDPKWKTLVVSLKAGGTGLNLTKANHVIHYDLWWNPAVEAQATDRAYRIGQDKNVMVHRFISSNTFEERIDEMLNSKKELADIVLSGGGSWITEMNSEELKQLVELRKDD